MYTVCFNLKSFDLNLLNQTEKYLLDLFSFFQFNEIKHQRKPKKIKKITVLRSPHIDKKSREQFQQITHKKTIAISLSNRNLVLLMLEILKTMNFRGVENQFVVEFSTF